MMSHIRRPSPYRYAAAVILSILLIPYAVPRAESDGIADGAIIALADYAGGMVIAARPLVLERIEIATGARTTLPLPAVVKRISAIATPANRDGSIYVAAPGSGVLRSADGGMTWTVRSDGLPINNLTGLASHANQSDTLYVTISGEGIFRSENAGVSWQLMDGGPEHITGTLIHSDMPGSMQTGWLFATTKAGISRSMDCFCLWRDTGTIAGKVYALSYHPSQPAHIYASTDHGLFLSQNGGESWKNISAPGSHITALVVTAAGELYAGSADGELYRSIDQAASWEPILGH